MFFVIFHRFFPNMLKQFNKIFYIIMETKLMGLTHFNMHKSSRFDINFWGFPKFLKNCTNSAASMTQHW